MWFRHRERVDAAFAKGLMFGKAVGARDERDRIIEMLDDWRCGHPDCDGDKAEVCYPKHRLIAQIRGYKND